MSSNPSPIWPLEPHTQAKHHILRRYSDAWLPIMSSWNGRIVYIDGFAGPGIYEGGEDGSPIIALKAALEHQVLIRSEIVFYFIEARPDRSAVLEGLLSDYQLPSNFKVFVKNSRFDECLTDLLDTIKEQKVRLDPIFAFIDPFGYSHTPMHLIHRLMANTRCEVLITFMYEEINRFWNWPNERERLDRLFGCSRPSLSAVTLPSSRRQIIHDLYLSQLSGFANIQFVRSFEMVNSGNRTDYFLFFGTNHLRGLSKMKEAMWRVDPTGIFQFSDATANPNQPTLFTLEPDFARLENALVDTFRGSSEIPIETLEEYTIRETPFLVTHLRRPILSPNPPKDTDGRREDSGRGWVRELQGRWPGVLG